MFCMFRLKTLILGNLWEKVESAAKPRFKWSSYLNHVLEIFIVLLKKFLFNYIFSHTYTYFI